MKKCPQCQRVSDDEDSFCLHDGTPLIEEPPPTVAFFPPSIPPANPAFVVDLAQQDEIPTQIITRQIHPTKSGSKNYAVLLLIGLLLGGVLVLTTFFMSGGFSEKKKDVAVKNDTNHTTNLSDSDNSATANSAFPIDTNKNDNTNSSENKTNLTTNANSNKKRDDGKYNGRVIMINAYIRSAPDLYAPEVDMLPMDDRIIIGKRANPNSPWYRATCEHGTKGWIHGNTIEFTR